MRWFTPYWDGVSGEKIRRVHPAAYPVEIPLRLIRMFSFHGDIVLDPFAGTGTTAVAAEIAGRRSISVEINPHYVRAAESRLAAADTPARQLIRSPRRGVTREPS
jgi:site-specific DNA-methyltransferase (adenine-specific)